MDIVNIYEVELEYDEYDLEVDDDSELEVEADTQNRMGNLDYNTLRNKPSINGVTLIGNKTSAELGIDQTFIHKQNSASDYWEIEHDRDKYPSVTIVDSAGSVVIGDVQYLSRNKLIVTFQGAFSGTAYLN